MEKKKTILPRVLLIILAVLLVIAAGLAVAAYAVWTTNEFTLELTMAGESEITLEYGSTYTDAGASAVFFHRQVVQQDVLLPIDGDDQTGKGSVCGKPPHIAGTLAVHV